MAANKASTALATALPTVENFIPMSVDDFGGAEVQLSAFMYSTKLCTFMNPVTKKLDWYPVIGIGLDMKIMTSDLYKDDDGNPGEFRALVVQLTQPCPVPETSGSKTLKMLPPGSIVLIPYGDKSKLVDSEKYFRDEKFAWEVFIKPLEAESLRNGNTMNHWKFVKGKQHSRSDLLTGSTASNGAQPAAGAA